MDFDTHINSIVCLYRYIPAFMVEEQIYHLSANCYNDVVSSHITKVVTLCAVHVHVQCQD